MADSGRRKDIIRLSLIRGIGPAKADALLSRFGDTGDIFGAGMERLRSLVGAAPAAALRREAMSPGETDDYLYGLGKKGISVLTLEDEEYPERLRHVYAPPPVLYVKGRITAEDNACLAIVGTRVPSAYGAKNAERFAAELASRGITVVSGLARGIDSRAHSSALASGGRTIAVMGTGADMVYPPENRALAEMIEESGALVSEFPAGTPPDRHNFPMRNRIISGMSLGVLVIEAGEKSGALITARHALEQGREVFAVPGSIDAVSSRGAHALIKQGAKLAEAAEDIMEELPVHSGQFQARPRGEGPDRGAGLGEEERAVYAALSSGPAHIDDIGRQSGMGAAAVSAVLLGMECKKLVKQSPGKIFMRR